MAKIIESFDGITEEVLRLREQITRALNEHQMVKVHLWQPGIMYEVNKIWKTVVDFINEWEGKPVIFYSNMVPLKEVKVEYHYVNDMFFEGNRLYEENKLCKNLLSKLETIAPNRKYKWDFLFGRKSWLKKNLYQMFLDNPVCNETFHTYYGKDTGKGFWSHHVVKPELNSAESITTHRGRFETKIRCSDLIDPEIYNQTYYSAVIETVIHNDFAMFSEKEAKPIMAQRPFVICGARHQLRAFRSLGFQTFSEVIDESYDEIEDRDTRFGAVLHSMQKLCELDPVEVYKILQPVLQHNKRHFLEYNWTKI